MIAFVAILTGILAASWVFGGSRFNHLIIVLLFLKLQSEEQLLDFYDVYDDEATYMLNNMIDNRYKTYAAYLSAHKHAREKAFEKYSEITRILRTYVFKQLVPMVICIGIVFWKYYPAYLAGVVLSLMAKYIFKVFYRHENLEYTKRAFVGYLIK